MLHTLTELHAGLLALTFFASAFILVYYFNITVISVMDASRWMALIGSFSFLILFVLRHRLHLTMLDGVFYTVFGITPLFLALMLFLNAQCDMHYSETHIVVERIREGSGYTLKLRNDAYQDSWHIRNLDRDEVSIRYSNLRLVFCDGIFGYKVMKSREMIP